MIFKLRSIVIVIGLALFSTVAQSASMEDTIKLSIAGGGVCKVYAEEVGGDVEAFSELNIFALKAAEEMGYTDDFQGFTQEMKVMSSMLKTMLMDKYGSKVDAYNDWCIRFYNGFLNGIGRAYE